MKKIKSLFLPFVTILVVMTSNAGCKKSGGKSSEATITAFSFATPAATVTISGTDISVVLTEPTDLTKLVATFTLSSGATVKVGDELQVSGTTQNDFTSPVTYTVTSQDGTITTPYTVTVLIQTQTSKEITSFSFETLTPVVSGTISGTNISLTVPYGTNVTNLVATFATTGATVKIGDVLQVSGTTPNDFTGPVTYTVTDKNGDTKNYTVTVTVAKPSEAKITSFSFADPRGIIDPAVTIDEPNHTISIMVSAGADITKLVATFATSGATAKIGAVAQVSGTTPNDFSNASGVIYKLTSQDGTVTQNYTVTVTTTNYAVIPDDNFRAFLKGAVPTAFEGTGYNADKLNVNDNSVTTSTNIDCNSKNIADLTGIEYFVGLTYLDCSFNKLNSLGVSKNTALTDLYCANNQLTSLDLSKNTALTTINCSSNGLTSLDLSKNTALTELYCANNQLTSLDVSKNTALTDLGCANNQLTTLDVSKNTALTGLDCANNQLTTLDVSKNTALTGLDCHYNQLTTLDISSQKNWGGVLRIYSNPVVTGENPITTLKVNVAQKDNVQVKKAKTNNPMCVISTYTDNSTETPVSSDYTPQ